MNNIESIKCTDEISVGAALAARRKIVEKTCPVCNAVFLGYVNKKTCSKKCKNRLYYLK